MANKAFTLEGGLPVTVYKRRGSRNLRLSVAAGGAVRVTIPAWAPYQAGVDFARARQGWIAEQQRPVSLLDEGQAVGKAHHLSFVAQPSAEKVSTRILDTTIVVKHPAGLSIDSLAVQKAAREVSVKAMRRQAEKLLGQRLSALAGRHGFTYKSVSIKRLKGRWGSCDQQSNIVLNLFLMQLPWELIDYVLLHELTHTRILRHGPDFWLAMEEVLPDSRALRERTRDYHPILNGSAPEHVA